VEAYRTTIPEEAGAEVHELFDGDRKPDGITFTSSSTVQNFVTVAGASALKGVQVASIGPVTSATARRLGIEVSTEAKPFTVERLVSAILSLFSDPRFPNP
jgi:uroporphyrinogen III methyltransferase / synthase